MKLRGNLLLPNLIALPVLLVVYLAGWREAAGFGLAVLVLMNLLILIRERQTRAPDKEEEEAEDSPVREEETEHE